MEVLNRSDFSKICRTCLIKGQNLSSIYVKNIIESLVECTGIQISENDGLPNLICPDCINNAYRAFCFKQTCIHSQEILKNILIKSDCEQTETLASIENLDDSNSKNFFEIINNESSIKVEQSHENNESNVISSSLEVTNSKKPKRKRLTKKQKLTCDGCGRVCACYTKIRKNQRTVKRKDDRFHYCRICEKTFKSDDSLRHHRRYFHGEKPSVRELCKICGKSVRYLRAHILQRHSAEKPFKCNSCEKQFAYRSQLLIHVRNRHEGIQQEKRVLCPLCGKAFRTNGELNKHSKGHNDQKRYKCEQCEREYKWSYSLTEHMKRHNEGQRNYACTYCDKRFFTKQVLDKHIRIHTGERPFRCDICSRAFTQKTTLKTHMKIHGNINF